MDKSYPLLQNLNQSRIYGVLVQENIVYGFAGHLSSAPRLHQPVQVPEKSWNSSKNRCSSKDQCDYPNFVTSDKTFIQIPAIL